MTANRNRPRLPVMPDKMPSGVVASLEQMQKFEDDLEALQKLLRKPPSAEIEKAITRQRRLLVAPVIDDDGNF
jgi:hypothetical protein